MCRFIYIFSYNGNKIECINKTIIEALLYSYRSYLYISRQIRLIVFIFRE